VHRAHGEAVLFLPASAEKQNILTPRALRAPREKETMNFKSKEHP